MKFDEKLQVPYDARTFRILYAKNYEYWFRLLQVIED